ncbi:MAG TPA: hypothetical protein VFA07_03440 [Chthonomonadaceae bacterium]|nr:hypothetical protein [Chthonomonadaceae bacterium]
MSTKNTPVQVTLKLPGDVYERVAHEAAQEQRQLEDLLSNLVMEGLAAKETVRNILEHVAEQYQDRLAREGKRRQSPDEVLEELRHLREQVAGELYP